MSTVYPFSYYSFPITLHFAQLMQNPKAAAVFHLSSMNALSSDYIANKSTNRQECARAQAGAQTEVHVESLHSGAPALACVLEFVLACVSSGGLNPNGLAKRTVRGRRGS